MSLAVVKEDKGKTFLRTNIYFPLELMYTPVYSGLADEEILPTAAT